MKEINSDDLTNEEDYKLNWTKNIRLTCHICGQDPWWPHLIETHNLSYGIGKNNWTQKQRVLR